MSDEKSKKFSIDADQSGIFEMPSVTRLLNRKSLGLPPAVSEGANPPPSRPASATPPSPPSAPLPEQPRPKAEEGIELEIREEAISFELESSGPSQAAKEISEAALQATFPHIVRAARPTNQSALLEWNRMTLKQTQDPLAKALSTLIEKSGVKSALFLGPVAGVTHFTANASFDARSKKALWSGVLWDPKVVPELWSTLSKAGVAELSPPSQATFVFSDRNVMRGAFGIEQEEWLTLVRVGTESSCRGILLLVSSESIYKSVQAILPDFSAQPSAKKAA